MPMLAWVRDGSTGRTAAGWSLVGIEAVGPEGRRAPLALRLYSTTEPGHQSAAVETRLAIREVLQHTHPKSLWVFDRGYDSRRHFELGTRLGLRWVVRINDKRLLVHRGGDKPAKALARGIQPTETCAMKRDGG